MLQARLWRFFYFEFWTVDGLLYFCVCSGPQVHFSVVPSLGPFSASAAVLLSQVPFRPGKACHLQEEHGPHGQALHHLLLLPLPLRQRGALPAQKAKCELWLPFWRFISRRHFHPQTFPQISTLKGKHCCLSGFVHFQSWQWNRRSGNVQIGGK